MSADTLEVIETDQEVEVTDDGDHDKFSHYARGDALDAAWFEGKPVVALCGKVWLPSGDPKKYPVCPTCKEIYEGLEP